MFTIIISEKGGDERRESFDKSEINLGRVQGNDLVLPKGNVSKHHARMLFRDGRFIVTDLKSTNGTYVNGRKIAQATIVREGDKVYVGDYVMRIENPVGNAVSAGRSPDFVDPAEHDASTQSRENPMRASGLIGGGAGASPSPYGVAGMPPLPPGGALPPGVGAPFGGASVGPPPLPGAEASGNAFVPPDAGPAHAAAGHLGPHRPPAGTIVNTGNSTPPGESVDAPPVDLSPAALGAVAPSNAGAGVNQPQIKRAPLPRPPTTPLADGPRRASLPPPAPAASAPPVPVAAASASANFPKSTAAFGIGPVNLAPSPQTTPPPAVNHQPVAEPPLPVTAAGAGGAASAIGGATAGPGTGGGATANTAGAPQVAPVAAAAHSVATSGGSANRPPRDASVQAGRRLALLALQNRVSSNFDLGRIFDPSVGAELEGIIRQQALQMNAAGDAPQGVDLESLIAEAAAELLHAGPLTELMTDARVAEVHVARFDQLVVVREGRRVVEPGFSSEGALMRAVMRLAAASGMPLRAEERMVERRHPSGMRLTCVVPPVAAAVSLSLVRQAGADRGLADFVRAGALSKAMSQFVEAAVMGRMNLLVFGSSVQHAADFAAALGQVGSGGERVCAVFDELEIRAAQGSVVHLASSADGVRAAVQLRPDRLLVLANAREVMAATLDAVAAGASGAIVAAAGGSLRQGFSRLVSQVILARPGAGGDGVRECIAECFDLVLEVGSHEGGRLRVLRIAELSGSDAKGVVSRDIFAHGPETAGDGGFAATGVMPRIVTELANRGLKLDAAIFKRATK